MFEKDNLQRLKKLDESFHSLEFPIKQTNLINHYMGGHSYGFHRDASLFTAITLFWREPKMFDGGALIFKKGDATVNPLAGPRDLIIFPGYTEHSVTKVKLKAGVSAGNMSGRISLSKFIKIV
jgi:predicted 2-oxoglutarate/Fe(II)-dependent dioxygenase YbiX